MVKQIFTHKIFLLLLLSLLLMVPVQSIMELNRERQAYRAQAIKQIMASTSGPQRLIGPVIVLPYTRELILTNGKETRREVETRYRYLLPEQLTATANMEVTPRKLGIYQAQLYQANVTLTGQLPAIPDWQPPRDSIRGQPYLSLIVSDARGIIQIPTITFANELLTVTPGARLGNRSGVHVPLTTKQQQGGWFDIKISLQGMEKFTLIPVGRDSKLTLSGNWPHPNFLGDFLPTTRTVKDQGFNADWQTSWFATDMENQFPDMIQSAPKHLPSFSVSLVQPVDHYQLNERAAKYALLFIGLTFISFFMFELLKGLRVHPIQYALVGMGLAIFYLVLLALTEHLGFGWAYLVAALASVLLNGFYLSHVLGGPKQGIGFAALLGLVYAILYSLLQAEEIALLLGALLLFATLALIMLLTRKLDWYQVMDYSTPATTWTAPQPSTSDPSHQS
ncbi:cell envelope integrity protein CreD [Aeromonas veronii]|uniref:cell envelope integrity protein CreD n=1 Tax=Aeromonas veronii TaxID=654 RepID=UPI003003FD98